MAAWMLMTPILPAAGAAVWARREAEPATSTEHAANAINRFFILAPSKSKSIKVNFQIKLQEPPPPKVFAGGLSAGVTAHDARLRLNLGCRRLGCFTCRRERVCSI